MSYTKFGEYARILRIQNHEVMGDMANKLKTSVSFLSAVETGKKNVPDGWEEEISTLYQLTSEEQSKLKDAIEASKTQYKISTKNAGNIQRQAVMQFARSFDGMDDETAAKILELLRKKGDD